MKPCRYGAYSSLYIMLQRPFTDIEKVVYSNQIIKFLSESVLH